LLKIILFPEPGKENWATIKLEPSIEGEIQKTTNPDMNVCRVGGAMESGLAPDMPKGMA